MAFSRIRLFSLTSLGPRFPLLFRRGSGYSTSSSFEDASEGVKEKSFAETIGLVSQRVLHTSGTLPFALRDRPRPSSPSFYTGLQNSTFHDFILILQQRLEALKKRHREAAGDEFSLPPDVFPTWITKLDLQEKLNCKLRTRQYRTIVSRLNEIYAQPNKGLEEEFLSKFRRSVVLKEEQKKVRVLDDWGRMSAIGRRKDSVAKVYVSNGTGELLVNGKQLYEYFPSFPLREKVISPLLLLNKLDTFNVWAKVHGGGMTGQSEAIRLGLSRALEYLAPANRPPLRKAGFLTRDSRVVESKKPGRKKARKLKQWVKR